MASRLGKSAIRELQAVLAGKGVSDDISRSVVNYIEISLAKRVIRPDAVEKPPSPTKALKRIEKGARELSAALRQAGPDTWGLLEVQFEWPEGIPPESQSHS